MSLFSRVLVGLAGVVAIGIGLSLVLAPVAFEASAGVSVAADPGLLSELRGTGGGLLVCGAFMLLGGIVRRYTRTALAFGAAMYLAYGVSRVLGVALDGSPGASLLVTTAVELSFGFLLVIAGRVASSVETARGEDESVAFG